MVAMAASSSRVASSTASTEPNRKCSRSTLVPLSETMVTPNASEIRKNAASAASSFSSVARATSPAPSAITKPAISPPLASANRLRPATRKPIAAPGKIACAMASPIRLMRRSIRNTPIGAAPSDSANAPASARRMNSYSAKGAIRRSYIGQATQACAVSSKASHICRAFSRLAAVSTLLVGPHSTA